MALIICVVLVGASAGRISTINNGRKALSMYGSESPIENTPPEYAFYIQAFGAFRSLIADIAFIRAEQLKEQARFYDAMTLHKWICALQPHFPTVWEYAAWNMSWNISVTTFTPEERWNWVYNGVKLLRDQGIPLNPRAVNLYRQLAWTFNNKMSEPTDDQNYAYKCNWAWRMQLLLGPPPDPLAGVDLAELADEVKTVEQTDLLEQAARRSRALADEKAGRTRDEPAATSQPAEPNLPSGELWQYKLAQHAAAEQIRLIGAAPRTLAALYERYPETRRMVAELRALGVEITDDPLSEDTYWRQEGLAFTFFKPYRELLTPTSLQARVTRGQPVADADEPQRQKIDQILGVRSGNPAGEALVRFLQRKVLTEVYKNEPDAMLELIETFGALDWRSVDAQALYWVVRGLVAGGETLNQFGNDKTNTARLIFFCLRNLFLRGHIIFEPSPDKIYRSYLSLNRDLNFIEPMHEAFIKYGPLFDPGSGKTIGAGETYRAGHVNFLTEAVRMLYLSGREADATRYYRYLRDTYGTDARGGHNSAFDKPLHDFVMESFKESLQAASGRDIMIAIGSWLYDAYNQLAEGDTAAYVRFVQAARRFHEDYMKDKRGDPSEQRSALPEFPDIQIDAFGSWLTERVGSPVQVLHKVRLWMRTPIYLRQAVYDAVLPQLKSECDACNLDVAKAFPEPKGMVEYRQQHVLRTRGQPEDDTETPAQPR